MGSADRLPLEVRAPRSTSVIVQRVPSDAAAAFLDWQRGISGDAAGFRGYQSTEVFPPGPGHIEWVVLIHFDDPVQLQAWLDSGKRAEWIARLPTPMQEFRLRTLPSGLGAWFASLADEPGKVPRWKSMLAVLCGLYPTVMILTLLLSPYTAGWGIAVSILVGNAASILFLEFAGMPIITRLLGPWLRRNGARNRGASVIGFVLIVTTLGLLAYLFGLLN